MVGLFLDPAQKSAQEHSSSLSVDGATPKTAAHKTITPHQDGHGHDHGHSNLETMELNLCHWGDLLHFSARSLCEPFHILKGRHVLFHLRIPATLEYQQVFGITLGGRKGQPFAQQICEKANGMSCFARDCTTSSRFLRWSC